MMIFQAAPSPDILTWLADNIGTFVLLIVIVWGAIKEWWVPGVTHRRMVDERNELLRLALKGTRVAEKTVQAVETIASNGETLTP